MTNENKLEHCSFCSNHKDKVLKLIVSEDVAICSDCIILCTQLLEDENVTDPEVKRSDNCFVLTKGVKTFDLTQGGYFSTACK